MAERVHSTQTGFSVVEGVVALCIAAILCAIAVPSMSGYARNYRLIGTANQIAFDIARARMQAIGQNVFIRIRFEDPAHYVRERSTDGVTYNADDVSVALPSPITASEAPAITFARNGIAAAATTIVVTDGHHRKRIDTNVLGRSVIS